MLQFFVNILRNKGQNSPSIANGKINQNHREEEMSSERRIQTSGTYDEEFYTLNIAFNDYHVVTLDGLSKEDMLELKSCIDCMIAED
jgi:hypothetical protein